MSQIKLNSINVAGKRVSFDYSVSADLKKYFNTTLPFFFEYEEDISSVPNAVLAILFLSNMLPVSWLTDSDLIAECADKNFAENVIAIKQGYADMFPLADFKGRLRLKSLVDCSRESTDKTAVFFSGGVDSYCTLIRNIDKKPDLITLWGSDILLTDIGGWLKVKNNVLSAAETFHVNNTFIKSSFRQVLNCIELDTLASAFTKRGWWGSLQHGIAIISHAAPYVWLHKISTQFIGASFCDKDENVHCASFPSIDEHMVIGSCRTVHDSFDYNRQQKIDEIANYHRNTGCPVNLRVCWQSIGGGNCCNCEKCFRTIMGIVVSGASPKTMGFDIEADSAMLKTIKEFVVWSEPGSVSLDYLWNPIKAKAETNKRQLTKLGTYKDVKWLLSVDFSDIESNLFRKRQQSVFDLKYAVEKLIPDSILKKLKP